MRNCCLILISSLFLFTSCQKEESQSEYVSHSYEEVKDYFITFDTIFDLEIDFYYVYFFSYQCVHCNNIKNEMIDYALKFNDMYFCHFESSFPRCEDKNYSLVGLTNVDDICLVGTPELVKIKNKTIIDYMLGEQEIMFEINNSN